MDPRARIASAEPAIHVIPRSDRWEDIQAARRYTIAQFQALDMIKADPTKSNEIMGAAVKQTGEQFAKSSSFLRWQDRAANQKFFAGVRQM